MPGNTKPVWGGRRLLQQPLDGRGAVGGLRPRRRSGAGNDQETLGSAGCGGHVAALLASAAGSSTKEGGRELLQPLRPSELWRTSESVMRSLVGRIQIRGLAAGMACLVTEGSEMDGRATTAFSGTNHRRCGRPVIGGSSVARATRLVVGSRIDGWVAAAFPGRNRRWRRRAGVGPKRNEQGYAVGAQLNFYITWEVEIQICIS